MNRTEITSQLNQSSIILMELFNDTSIIEINNNKTLKLILFQLVIIIAQNNSQFMLPQLENTFNHNQKLKFSVTMKNALADINQVIQEIVFDQSSRKRGGTEKCLYNSPITQNYIKFRQLYQDFEAIIQSDKKYEEIINHSPKIQKYDSFEQGGNEALLQQYQDIVAKKEKRIKQLNEEIQQLILQQKSQQDLNNELQFRNIDLKQQIKELNQKLQFVVQNSAVLQAKIEYLRQDNQVKDRKLQKSITKDNKDYHSKHHQSFSQKYEKTYEKSQKNKKQNQILDINFEQKQQLKNNQKQILFKMITIQALSLQALI